MGGFGSLSEAATEVTLNISEWALIIGGVILVIGLIGELKADDKRTVRQKLWYKRFELMVILGVAIELAGDGGIFFSSRRLQTLAGIKIARLQFAALPRAIRLETSETIFPCLKKAPKGSVFVAYPMFNSEAKDAHLALLNLLRRAGYDAKEQPLGTNALIGFSAPGISIFTHDRQNAPSYAVEIEKCLGGEFRPPIGDIHPATTPWVGPNDILIGVDADSRPQQ